MRAPVIAGNWKMYKTAGEAAAFVRAFLPLVSGVRGVEIVLAPPYLSIAAVAGLVKGSGIGVASQNVHFADEGAFTGEVSARMLAEAGATHCIIGHSERRQYYAETDDAANRKVRAALAAGLTPILCVGEMLPDREGGKTFDVVGRQLDGGLKEIPAAPASRVIVAYEPVWAIGTGKTATPAQAQEVHAFLRGRVKELWGSAADSVRILYGGSVKPDNIAALMANDDIDGALVGGASLSPESFAKIVKFH
ncbi:MAG: triose-phosphate isomerase [bacterium]|nr:triose-phosphate isomerase [bacterium]